MGLRGILRSSLAVAVFALFVPLLFAQTSFWSLSQKTFYLDQPTGGMVVRSASVTSAGGQADIAVPRPCGLVGVHVSWQFRFDVSQVSSGAVVPLTMQADPGPNSGTCKVGEAPGTFHMAGAIGVTQPVVAATSVDGDRFVVSGPNNVTVCPFPYGYNCPRQIQAQVNVSTRAPWRPGAFFILSFASPTLGTGSVNFIYVYSTGNVGTPGVPAELQTMTTWAGQYSGFFGAAVPGSFVQNYAAWSNAQWTMSYSAFALRTGGQTWVVLATNKSNGTRFIEYYNPQTGSWEGWFPA